MKLINIKINFHGRRLGVECSSDKTVGEFKAQLQKRIGIEAITMEFIIAHQKLSDDTIVGDVWQLVGGMPLHVRDITGTTQTIKPVLTPEQEAAKVKRDTEWAELKKEDTAFWAFRKQNKLLSRDEFLPKWYAHREELLKIKKPAEQPQEQKVEVLVPASNTNPESFLSTEAKIAIATTVILSVIGMATGAGIALS